ncbi:MAG: YihY/virulence factor BrkB family protein [Treponema sp.]|jgi:membrane protein|nr:YihY/virulence factor BrkB family protein [Treponema sp.]
MVRQKSPLGLLKKAVSLAGCVTRPLWLGAEFFGRQGLANHAAAGAYGFFLSAAPALLIVSFFIFRTIQTSPEAVVELVSRSGFFSNTFDIPGIIKTFLATQKQGIPGFISVLSVLWAAVVFSSVMRRGLEIVFIPARTSGLAGNFEPKSRGLLGTIGVSLGIEAALILFTFAAVMNSYLMIRLFQFLGIISPRIPSFFRIGVSLIPNLVMILLVYCAYSFIPSNPPKPPAALGGTAACLILYGAVSFLLHFILLPGRYNILYGTLGSLIIFIINVYFFFLFFFFGAELSYVIDSFDVLYFSKFRKIHSSPAQKYNFFEKHLFASFEGPLHKYIRRFKKGDVIMRKNDINWDVYYLVSGEVGIFLDSPPEHEGKDPGLYPEESGIAIVGEGNFFGEMEYLLDEPRSAGARALRDAVTLALPPEFFWKLINNDPAINYRLIEILSERLKHTDEKFTAASQEGG